MLTKLFEFTAPFEEFCKKDLCDWDIYKMSEVLNAMDKELKEFCIDYCAITKYVLSYDVKRDKMAITSDKDLLGLENYNGYVFSADHLEYIMNTMYESVDRNNRDLLCRGIMWLFYAGFTSIDECITLTKEDFGEDLSYVLVKGHKIKLHPYSKDVFRKLIELDTFTDYRTKPNRVYSSVRHKSELVFRTSSKTTESCDVGVIAQEIKRLISALNRKSGLVLKPKRVRVSAIYEKAYLEEILGVWKNDFKDTLLFEFLISDTKPNRNASTLKLRFYRNGYKEWKSYFIKNNNNL